MTTDYLSPDGLPPAMKLDCRLTSVRGNTEEKITKNEPLVRQKHIKKKLYMTHSTHSLSSAGLENGSFQQKKQSCSTYHDERRLKGRQAS